MPSCKPPALIVLLVAACGLFPDGENDDAGATSSDTLTTGVPTGGGPAIDPDPDSIPPAPIDGELGHGQFEYFCVDDRDPGCLGLTDGHFPAAIAVGGQFLLDYRASGGGTLQPESASKERINFFGRYQALVEGDTVMFARANKDGEKVLIDLLTLHVATPSEVLLQRNDLTVNAVFVEPDDEVTLSAVTRDANKLFLAGTLEFTWTLDDDQVAVITTMSPGGARVRGLAPGKTHLTASLGELSASVVITVGGEPDATGGTTDITTTGTDTGTTGAP